MKNNVSELRNDYYQSELNKNDIDPDPFIQFKNWLHEAISSKVQEPTAMTLATSSKEGIISARIVLLKGMENNKFIFFTNYQSKKGQQIRKNPNVALLFFWPELERQIRIEGEINKLNIKESDAYFYNRPKESKIAAWLSTQSETIPTRNLLDNLYIKFENKFKNKIIHRPPFWGGYSLQPRLFEFWQGRPNRLHDRLQYILKNKSWKIKRLAP